MSRFHALTTITLNLCTNHVVSFNTEKALTNIKKCCNSALYSCTFITSLWITQTAKHDSIHLCLVREMQMFLEQMKK